MSKKIQLIIPIIIVAIIVVIAYVSKSTYGKEAETSISLSCPAETAELMEVDCDILLQVENNDTITGVKANYVLPSGVEYVSFTKNNACQSKECFENLASTQNGFLQTNINGLSKNASLGKLRIKFNEKNVENKAYTIKLTNVELVNKNLDNIESVESNDIITINNTITINNSKIKDNIIYEIKDKTKYTEFIKNVATNGNVTIKNKNGTQVNTTDIVKTGDIINIKAGNNEEEYRISVLGDTNGDGNVNVIDVARIFQHYRGKNKIAESEKYYILAGDTVGDDNIKLNDVAKLFQYVRGKISSLN